MSSFYVRALVEGWLQDPSMEVPYYPTINREQNPQDGIWCSASFMSGYRDVLGYCEGLTTEEGEVEIRYFGLPGIGDSAVIQAAETDMATLMAQRDPAGKCVLMRRSAPLEASNGSARNLYSIAVYVDYQYYA